MQIHRQDASSWKGMASAPKDGSRIIVVIRASEQGGSDIDVVHWARPTRGRSDECWLSTESSADCPINYEDWEVTFWMPLPSSLPPVRSPDLTSRLPPIPKESDGSGI